MSDVAEGFVRNGRVVFALLYRLESVPPTGLELVVPLDRNGNATSPTRPADKDKRMVQVRPGDFLVHLGQSYRVVGVQVFRSLPIDQGSKLGLQKYTANNPAF